MAWVLDSQFFRTTLFFVAENQNVTLSLPRKLLRLVKRLAAERDTSVSSLMTRRLRVWLTRSGAMPLRANDRLRG